MKGQRSNMYYHLQRQKFHRLGLGLGLGLKSQASSFRRSRLKSIS